MRPVLVTLFWCWFAFSLSVYAYRLYRRVTQGPRAEREARAAATAVAATPAPRPEGPARPPRGPGADPERSPLRGGDTAPGAVPSSTAPVRATVAQALAGIALPCDLAPLTGTDALPDPHRLVCFTDRTHAETVGTAIGGELERLGYTVRSVSATRTVATRDGTGLTVTVHPTREAFPTAPPGSVVVVFST